MSHRRETLYQKKLICRPEILISVWEASRYCGVLMHLILAHKKNHFLDIYPLKASNYLIWGNLSGNWVKILQAPIWNRLSGLILWVKTSGILSNKIQTPRYPCSHWPYSYYLDCTATYPWPRYEENSQAWAVIFSSPQPISGRHKYSRKSNQTQQEQLFRNSGICIQ